MILSGAHGASLIYLFMFIIIIIGLFGLNGELLRLVPRFATQIIHARLQPLGPGVKVHGRQRRVVRVLHPQVHALALANECAPVCRHVNHVLHRNLPYRAVLAFQVFAQATDVLHAALIGHDVVFDGLVPQSHRLQIRNQMPVHQNELARHGATRVNVAGNRLKALRVAQNLRRAGGRHRCQQQRVP